MNTIDKPLVIITGAAGDIGSALAEALASDYKLVGLDRPGTTASIPLIPVDLTSAEEIERAFAQLREQHGPRIASVIHLAAYFDFTSEDHPLYEKLNAEVRGRYGSWNRYIV